ncbi:MAG: response regulator [Nitrospirales bacterium]|nr:response regulator [Nitrospira sp.]MDR4501059.1 response regulator [Nitrospirales bacterium]
MPSVLIIDDDEQVCGVLREAFEVAGFDARVAHNGEEGTSYYTSSPTDVVILDILMPEKEGLETILELRREFPTIKIIAISGGSERAHVNLLDLAHRLGAHHTVKKPFKMQEVVDLAKSLLAEPST